MSSVLVLNLTNLVKKYFMYLYSVLSLRKLNKSLYVGFVSIRKYDINLTFKIYNHIIMIIIIIIVKLYNNKV
jgi:hypothetical protein